MSMSTPPLSQRLRDLAKHILEPRLGRGSLVVALTAGLIGFAFVTQVRQTSAEGLQNLREDELVRILDSVDQDATRLSQEINTLENTRDRLLNGNSSTEEARKAAQQRLDTLGILTGTMPATGPGIVLTVRDPDHKVNAPILLDTLQELRDAGAEAVQIGRVRVVANTYFTDVGGGVAVSGEPLTSPYVIRVIGDGETLAAALEIPGGVGQTVRGLGGTIEVVVKDSVTISALQTVSPPQYARPVTPTPSSTS